MVASSAPIVCRMLFLPPLVLILYFQFVLCQILTSTLHSTEYGLKFAYDGEIVSFTCIAEGNSMAWSSDEYIGSDGNRLEFVSIEQKGTKYRAGQTVATLINVTNVNGLTILESLLQISVRSVFQISSIRCHNVGSDTVNTISFGTSGNASITCDKLSACPGETVRCTCITGYSNTLAWSSDQLIGPNDARLEFVSIDPVNTTLKVPGSNTSAVLANISRLNDVVVLFSDLTFVASDDPANILTCVNVGQQSSYSIIIPILKYCGPVSTPYLSTPNATTDLAASTETIYASSSPRSDKSNVTIGVSVFFSTLVILLLLAIFMLVIRIFHIRKSYKLRVDVAGSYEDHQAMDLVPVPLDSLADTQVHSLTQKVHDDDQDEQATSQDVSTISTSNDSKEIKSDSKEDTTTQETHVFATAVLVGAEIKERVSTGPTNVLSPIDVSPPEKEGKIEKRHTEGTEKAELSHVSNSLKLPQSKSADGATRLPCLHLTGQECKRPNENVIENAGDMMALVDELRSQQKDVIQEVHTQNRKKLIESLQRDDVRYNAQNNFEDAGGGKKQAQADKGSNEGQN